MQNINIPTVLGEARGDERFTARRTCAPELTFRCANAYRSLSLGVGSVTRLSVPASLCRLAYWHFLVDWEVCRHYAEKCHSNKCLRSLR